MLPKTAWIFSVRYDEVFFNLNLRRMVSKLSLSLSLFLGLAAELHPLQSETDTKWRQFETKEAANPSVDREIYNSAQVEVEVCCAVCPVTCVKFSDKAGKRHS